MRSSTSPTEWTAPGEITSADHNAAGGDDARQLPALDQASLKRAGHDGPCSAKGPYAAVSRGVDRPLASNRALPPFLLCPARKPLTFARGRSTSARKPGTVACKPKTPKCKVKSIEARRRRASHARVRPLRARLKPPPATPAPLRTRLRPSPRQGCEACTPGVEVCVQDRRVCAQRFGVARKAEEACVWRYEGCAWCCARTPTGAAARSAAFQTRRLGQEAWWAAFQAQRAEVRIGLRGMSL